MFDSYFTVYLTIHKIKYMKHPIKTLKIKNFKSIKELELECSKVNILVGKPNVGKSNILEALGLFDAPYSYHNTLRKNKIAVLSDFMRFNHYSNLFYNNDISKIITVNTNIGNALLKYRGNDCEIFLGQDIDIIMKYIRDLDTFLRFIKRNDTDEYDKTSIPYYYARYDSNGIKERLDYHDNFYNIPIKKYEFKKFNYTKKAVINNIPFLLPSDGSNLFEILQSYPDLRIQVSDYFREYGLKLLLDFENKSLQVQKEVDGIAYKTPYNLIADTLQRIIFHYAAIESNKESILLFEEPENHSFPPYIKHLADKIAADKKNQYFITTHSPYLLNTIIENVEDISVFVTTFKNYETKAKKLSSKDLSELLDNGVDLFFNLKWFEDE